MTGIEWTEERALVAARNAENEEFRWKRQRVPGALAHRFSVEHGWMTSSCGDARWGVNWWPTTETAGRCTTCSEIAERSIETAVRAILVVDGRAVV